MQIARGVELVPKSPGISSVCVTDMAAKKNLTWDRFIRLQASASVLPSGVKSILDAGGYDGALGFFLADAAIDLIDQATTGGSVLAIPAADRSYDAVMAIDVLEHIEPQKRAKALSEFARVAKQQVVLNYPCRDSKSAQELVLRLTNNALIKEHVEWLLPDSEWVLQELGNYGFSGTIKAHGSTAIWLGQYLTLNLAPGEAIELNKYLVENHADEPWSKPLYHLLTCTRPT